MSIVSTLIPFEIFAANAMAVARPLLGLSMLAAVLVFFKPLLVGILRASLLVLKPRQLDEQQSVQEQAAQAQDRLKSALEINRIARDVERAHPSLAFELRAIAARQ